MDKVVVWRNFNKDDVGTFGVVTVNDRVCCFSLENHWQDNQRNISCIPNGTYFVKRDNTGRHRYWKILEVPNRDNIEIHSGNLVEDTLGCVLFGSYIGYINGERCVKRSKDALEVFDSMLSKNCNEFKIEFKTMSM